ncbi:MAG: prepilin-type N-terminal cleavage/methylation domain-containing protein [Candidatus Riflebacteria bacterium]|nr:prepilin-type N-terminal cleavage/methylation domain-containing protein [Candidatus Riflebacteria bacterium]
MNNRVGNGSPGNVRGYTLIEIMIVTLIISVLLALMSYSYTGIRNRIRRTSCMENMRVIYKGAMLCQTERADLDGKNLTVKVLCDEGYLRRRPACPSNGKYWIQSENGNLRVTCVETNDGISHGYYE